LALAHACLRDLVGAIPGLILEDKGQSLALHYRQVPQAAEAVRQAVDGVVARTNLLRQDGAMVCEVRSPGPGKGEALSAFLDEAPFEGRLPVMVGDDLTDEGAFAAAARAGGFGVLVGPARPTAAAHRLPDVRAVLAWLAAALTAVTA
jgi:trehalose 6-phosphate phosphatase